MIRGSEHNNYYSHDSHDFHALTIKERIINSIELVIDPAQEKKQEE